jgi:16S rRNA (guanine527-N7)-methyltransferase
MLPELEPELRALAARHGLTAEAERKLGALLGLLVEDPCAPTSIKTAGAALNDHLADSLVGLECASLNEARNVVDLGSGAGLPGLPLAIALPQASFTLLESSARKCRFLKRAIETCRITNAEVVHARAESLPSALERYDVALARALAPLPVTLEYAAPLLRVGGRLIVWRGRCDPDAEAAAARAAPGLGLGEASIRAVLPYAGAQHRHLYAVVKTETTPARFPRRPGIAAKRPLGVRSRAGDTSSDREPR